jgi:hypothetical protein
MDFNTMKGHFFWIISECMNQKLASLLVCCILVSSLWFFNSGGGEEEVKSDVVDQDIASSSPNESASISLTPLKTTQDKGIHAHVEQLFESSNTGSTL